MPNTGKAELEPSRVRIPVANVTLGEEEARAVAEVVRSGRVSAGARVREFEETFAAYTDSHFALAVSSGTAALHVALAALGVGPGDEVVVPTLTFVATANVVLYQGATPVFCECNPETYNVDGKTLRAALTPRTKAIIPVEMNGLPVDYDEILALVAESGVAIVLDSAESLGGRYKDRPVGSIAPIHCFSFFPNKIMTTGEGGMITTNDEALAARMRIILNQGQDGRYHHVMLGYNYRMTEVQAALGLVQLRKVEQRLQDKETLARHYTEAFRAPGAIEPPVVPPYATRHSWYMYSVHVSAAARDRIVADLAIQGIETRLSFPPVHIQPYYAQRFGYTRESFPISYAAWSGKIDLPIWPGLSEDQQDTVIRALKAAVKSPLSPV